MSKIYKTTFFLIIICFSFLLTGCYDRFEIDNLAYVIAIGADVGSGDNLDITYQVAIPAKITGDSSKPSKDNYVTYTISAPSLSVANNLINTKISKGITLSHVKLVVYSEDLAKMGLSGHVNVLVSNSNIRPKVTLTVCQGTAKEFLENITPKLETSPSRYYELIFSAYNFTTQSEPSQLIDVYSAMQSIDRNAFATYVRLSDNDGNKEAELSGIAIFKGTKMIAQESDKDFLLAHSILTNNLKQSGYAIKDFKRKDRFISVRLVQNQKPKIRIVTNSGDAPIIKCDIVIEAHLVSSGSNIDFYKKENENRLKKELDNNLKQIIENYFDKTIKEYNSDVAQVGKYAKMNFQTWNEFEKYDWLNKYKNCSYEVNVDAKLNISQIISHVVPNIEK